MPQVAVVPSPSFLSFLVDDPTVVIMRHQQLHLQRRYQVAMDAALQSMDASWMPPRPEPIAPLSRAVFAEVEWDTSRHDRPGRRRATVPNRWKNAPP